MRAFEKNVGVNMNNWNMTDKTNEGRDQDRRELSGIVKQIQGQTGEHVGEGRASLLICRRRTQHALKSQ